MTIDTRDTQRSLPPGAASTWHAEQAVMTWHGWGSPVGIGLLLIAIGITAVLIRHAVLGG
ncbi:MAG: hypothetical protein J0H01_02560 [Rhizobiales bacterium]|nr:hypothetical protein [Hyphomicrobiales bacterium]